LFSTHFQEELQMKKCTIIALAVAITAFFTVTATANEWNLYGSARMATFYTSEDLDKGLEEVTPGQFIAVQNRDIANQDNISDLRWNLQTNSRIGAKVKGDMLEGQFEFGVTSDGAGGNVSTRRLYGIWKFAEGWGLKVGKDYTPIIFFLSGQAFNNDSGLKKLGVAYGDRRGQIAVEGKLGPGMLKFALIDPSTSTLSTPDSTTEKILPKIEASYQMKFTDAISAHAFGGFQTYDIKTADLFGGTDSKSVQSWMVGLGGDLNFGPFYAKPQVSYYRNGAAAGWLNANYLTPTKRGFVQDFNDEFGSDLPVDVVSNDVLTAKNLMAMLALGFKPTETLGLEFGVGYIDFSTDSIQGISIRNNYLEYYLQAVITLAKGVYIIPEIGYRDFGKDKFDKPFYIVAPDVDNGSLFYAGAKWQIDF
jgi:hypothetical protein